MANFLSNLGAVIQGQQNYQNWETQQEQAKLRIENEKENLANIKDLAAQAKKNRARETDIAQGTLDYLTGIPVPPPQPPAVQPPPPGQQSQPMIDPNQAQVPYPQQQRSLGPQGPQGGLPPGMQLGQPPGPPQGGPPQGFFQGQPQGPQGMPQGMQQGQPPGQPPGPPPIPPYQTVQGGPSGPPPQQGPQGIPPPPPQQPGQPRPNSMSIQDAAKFIKAQGIKDPVTSLQILDRLTPYLDNQAKQEAQQLKLQLEFSQKEAQLKEKIRNDDLVANNAKESIEVRKAAAESANQTKLILGQLNAGIAQQNANTKAKESGGGAGISEDGKPRPGVEAAAWNYLLKNQSPPARGGLYGQTMAYVEQIAKENNMSVQELTSASADVKTKLQAKKNFEVRAQNMERAENQIIAEVPLIRDAIKQIDLSKYPQFAKAEIWGLRQLGDERITRLDQAVETVFNEFEGIRTGNPGALNVSDVQNAHKAYENAKTPQQMEAAIQGIERTIANAKKAKSKTDANIMKEINDSFKKEKTGPAVPILSNQAELSAAIKSGKLKKGDTFNDPSGASHVVN